MLEGSADSSKESLVLFEPRALDYDKVCQVLEETGDEAKALLAGKAETRAPRPATRCPAYGIIVLVHPPFSTGG